MSAQKPLPQPEGRKVSIVPGTIIGFVSWPEKLKIDSKTVQISSVIIVPSPVEGAPTKVVPVGKVSKGSKTTTKNKMVTLSFKITSLSSGPIITVGASTTDGEHVSESEQIILKKTEGQTVKLFIDS